MKKTILSLLCVALLCGCTANTNDNSISEGNASSSVQTQTKTSTNVAQTTVEADALNAQSFSREKIIWGPGREANHQQPSEPLSLNQKYSKLGASFLLNDKKSVCLTFDEGYENGFTPSILDTLKEKKVKAIFFVTYDFAKDNPDLIKRMIDEGHIVGNHTYRHYTMDEIGIETATEEVMLLHSFIKEKFNYEMTLFRFPKGEFSESSLALVNDLGYKSVFWSFAYADWDTQNPPDKAEALKTICDYTHDGEILLLHAVSATNAEILGDVIDDIRGKGYKFSTEV